MSRDILSSIHLRRTDENSADIDAAAEQLGRRTGLAGVLAHLNRQAVRARVPGRAVDWGFRWSDDDLNSQHWWPQGITTSADASDTEDIDGRRLLMTSWYSKGADGRNGGSRVTVVDLDTLEYRHVLLVAPLRRSDGQVELKPLLAHAGGLVWCGPYLHVAGTRRGLFSCLVDDIIRVESTEDTFGYRYVLPVRFAYDADASEGVEKMRYSFLSLDRGSTPPQLVAGEYGVADMTRRLVRYPLDPKTFHLAAHEDGTSRPVWLDERGMGHMQGATVVGDTYYVTASRGRRRLGQMYVGEPGHFRAYPRTLPVGPEDISYWPSTDLLWSLTEYPSRRFVFAMRRSHFHR
ncbi:MAG: hypothetical protein JWR90_3764 [Marmoricola sp.]|nr:hypothetical protein [Marmoricola sp.]